VVKKETGGIVKILFIEIVGPLIKVMANKSLTPGLILSLFTHRTIRPKGSILVVKKRIGKFWLLEPSFPVKEIYKILDQYGEMPIPPYIKNSPLTKSELKKEYQTVFARARGSVAAPTAALHFTKNLMTRIKKAGHEIIFVTLHVNLGTFAPLTAENLRTGKLHTEYYEISVPAAKKLNQAKKAGRPIIAVGTTSLRALESGSKNSRLTKLGGKTNLFIGGRSYGTIRPNGPMKEYKFKFIDSLVTNFHVPRSSLLMLVSALVGREKLLGLYRRAIMHKFRFFSFGDGMLIL
jgi:S-adenosylmethionine:tRNA ribosyltransferase-isomerase